MENKHFELYADALDGILLGYPVTKLTFVTTLKDESVNTDTQINRNVVTLTVPTIAIVDACHKILDNIRENRKELTEMQGKTSDMLDRFLGKT